MIPETEVVDAVGRFGYGKERFAVVAFDAHHHYIIVAPFDGSRIEGGIDTNALHKERIGLGVIVITPKEWRMGSCNDRIFVAIEDTVALDRIVLATDEGFVLCLDQGLAFIEVHNRLDYCMSFRNNV